MLVETMKARLKEAMKAKKTVEKEILRVALGEVQTAEARSGVDLKDAEVEKILRKLVKSNRETLDATQDTDRRAVLEEETAVLDSLLPQTLDVDAIVAALADVTDAIKAAGNDGQATGVAMKHLKKAGATVQGKDVAAAVKRIRS